MPPPHPRRYLLGPASLLRLGTQSAHRRYGARRVDTPQPLDAGIVVGCEEQRVVDLHKAIGIRAGLAGTQIFQQDRPCRAAVALPKFPAVLTVTGGKNDPVAHVRQVPRRRTIRPRVDVFDEHRPGLCAVALPKLHAVYTVGRGEVHGPLHVCERTGKRVTATRVDVLDEDRTAIRTVAFPQLDSVLTVR